MLSGRRWSGQALGVSWPRAVSVCSSARRVARRPPRLRGAISTRNAAGVRRCPSSRSQAKSTAWRPCLLSLPLSRKPDGGFAVLEPRLPRRCFWSTSAAGTAVRVWRWPSSRLPPKSAAGRLCLLSLPLQHKPVAALFTWMYDFRDVRSGRRPPRAPSPACSDGHRAGYHPTGRLASRASDGGASGAILLRGGALCGTVPNALTVLDRVGSESWCSDLAVGVDGWWWWNAMRKGRRDGQRSRPRGRRRYRFHAPRPGLATILFKVIER